MKDAYGGNYVNVTGKYLDWYYSQMPSEERRKETTDDLYEHIAGPNCVHYIGYSGHVITAEEMKYCTTLQYIVPYDQDYHESDPLHRPEPDDDDFERKGEYHLSGLTDRCALWEHDCSVYIKRHGCYEVYSARFNGFHDGEPPFHPHCLEIYRRVSGLRRGTTDILDLARWNEHQFEERLDHPEQWIVVTINGGPIVPGMSSSPQTRSRYLDCSDFWTPQNANNRISTQEQARSVQDQQLRQSPAICSVSCRKSFVT